MNEQSTAGANTPDDEDTARLILVRDARLFMRRPELDDELAGRVRAIDLAPSELLHPACPADFVVRLGRLRVTEFLPDGREVTRAVLQAGSCFATREAAENDDSDYPLERAVLMALGDTEIWRLAAGALDDLNTG